MLKGVGGGWGGFRLFDIVPLPIFDILFFSSQSLRALNIGIQRNSRHNKIG